MEIFLKGCDGCPDLFYGFETKKLYQYAALCDWDACTIDGGIQDSVIIDGVEYSPSNLEQTAVPNPWDKNVDGHAVFRASACGGVESVQATGIYVDIYPVNTKYEYFPFDISLYSVIVSDIIAAWPSTPGEPCGYDPIINASGIKIILGDSFA